MSSIYCSTCFKYICIYTHKYICTSTYYPVYGCNATQSSQNMTHSMVATSKTNKKIFVKKSKNKHKHTRTHTN